MSTQFTSDDVLKIASLAAIPVTDSEKKELATGFTAVIKVLDTLNKIDVSGVTPTYQVTGLTNVFREDVVDKSRMFTQEEALANAPKSHDGFFMVDAVIDQNSE
jgi:aspartyl-tRNA(Asn)/glutamyl-tRNA(Gln) amidotransferase subunit C